MARKAKTKQTNESVMKEMEKKYGKEVTANPHFQSFVTALIAGNVKTK